MPVKLAFGSVIERNNTLGVYYGLYPELDIHLVRKDNPKTAPNTYNPLENVSNKGCTWHESYYNMATFDKQLKGKAQSGKELTKKEVVLGYAGPGSYEIDISSLKKSLCPAGKIFTTSKRGFLKKNDNPGPGAYDPDIYKRSSIVQKKKNLVGCFEWDGFKDRFPLRNTTILPPNWYNPKDPGGLDALLNKVVSRRGPYDLFTGPRDSSTIKNHFACKQPEGSHDLYLLKSELEQLLNHPRKQGHGKFKRAYQKEPCKEHHEHTNTCYVLQDSPGPASYDITWHTIKQARRCKYGFGQSSRNIPIKGDSPGPGRYFLDVNKKHEGKERSDFLRKLRNRKLTLKKK